jgi:hypothetical protein
MPFTENRPVHALTSASKLIGRNSGSFILVIVLAKTLK